MESTGRTPGGGIVQSISVATTGRSGELKQGVSVVLRLWSARQQKEPDDLLGVFLMSRDVATRVVEQTQAALAESE